MKRRGRILGVAAAATAAVAVLVVVQALATTFASPISWRRNGATGIDGRAQSGATVFGRAHRQLTTPTRLALRQATAGKESGAWILPSVDKDTGEWFTGFASGYAFVQTSETLYIFAPAPEGTSEENAPEVELALTDEGTKLRLTVAGKDAISGSLSHALKPESQIWMVEDAADGRSFVVVEADKLHKGREWTSVIRPEVSFVSDYSHPKVQLQRLDLEAQAETVEATLEHLRRKQADKPKVAEEGHLAVNGNVLSVDMHGFELLPDGSRGAALDIGAAQGMQMELGATGSGLPQEVHEKLVGISKGETRDVEVTLGQRAGSLGGQRIICSIECQEIGLLQLPELDDDFARKVKREEQFRQAGTLEGIPEEEADAAETFTLAQLKAEIAGEIQQHVVTEEKASLKAQLEEVVRQAAEVHCEWADLGSGTSGGDRGHLQRQEELAAIVESIAAKEGLLPLIDEDAVKREAWQELSQPPPGETTREVGKDPAREFQDSWRQTRRRHELEQVLGWLESHAELETI